MKLGLIKEMDNFHDDYINACIDLNIDYQIIDIESANWIKNIKKFNGNGLIVRPSCGKAIWENMYNEKMYFINKILNIPIYPSYNELLIYENKRAMAYWLEIHNISHPKTFVFYNKDEAIDFINGYNNFPLIFKPNIGSASIGIKEINTRRKAINLINKAFTKYKFYNRGITKWKRSGIGIYYPLMDDKQFNNILFQEKIHIKHEWRGVKIGESYFAHKKLAGKDGFHSGSGKASYDNPPIQVMEFIKSVCDIGQFRSMNVDFFEDIEGRFFVNELQTIFGSNIKPYQMCVDGVPGRYVVNSGEWVFEEGDFNQNNSWNLRIKDAIQLFETREEM